MESWREKIARGMELIKQGCQEQTTWAECKYCPFERFCLALDPEQLHTPSDGFESGENA